MGLYQREVQPLARDDQVPELLSVLGVASGGRLDEPLLMLGHSAPHTIGHSIGDEDTDSP